MGVIFMSDIIIVISDIVKPFLLKSPTSRNYFLAPPDPSALTRNPRYNSAMPMTPFMERFPELAARETRSVTLRDRDDLPNGEYGFIEFYCDEPHCDCRRVMVVVLRPETGWKFWAAINYGWESVEFYRRWAGAPPSDDSPWQGPVLDPLTEPTPYAPALLELFKFILQSPGYVPRLQKHYQLFRAAVEEEAVRKDPTPRSPAGSTPPRRAK
jgi:hypothetical protein